MGPRACLDGCGKSRLHRDSIPDRPARSESLYRLRCLGTPFYEADSLINLQFIMHIRPSILLHTACEVEKAMLNNTCEGRCREPRSM
jgi:hypothetical protein